MKKNSLLLFICLNLFAKEVYDLRNEFVAASNWLRHPWKLDDMFLLSFAKDHLQRRVCKII